MSIWKHVMKEYNVLNQLSHPKYLYISTIWFFWITRDMNLKINNTSQALLNYFRWLFIFFGVDKPEIRDCDTSQQYIPFLGCTWSQVLSPGHLEWCSSKAHGFLMYLWLYDSQLQYSNSYNHFMPDRLMLLTQEVENRHFKTRFFWNLLF